MSLKLFEHNQVAYNDALEMLEEYGKAAVVHPTGTGKSYIGFKVCEQFPDSTVCWLSPSEYIYKTQLENLKEDSDGWQPENVVFLTYAKLMLMNENEIAEINPDFIILDEFHRCGAELWGDGVNRLLAAYPSTPVLGLSATAIRYLDNQRNMVDELFDGNIASEMTLGEAIVRGILNPPKYVLSVFAYQEDYDKLKRRVYRAKNRAVRDKAEKYLESLRRALELADGMDVIFDKHITDRTGKYIVFCSNIDHLREMQSNVVAWFSKIDKNPHIYTAYSLDSATEKEFEAFKKDESDHLKLLFCIDMLNEGVHVENVSGVILFRPTVSPIIYKQQIGRALSASKTKNPIIFDIVNNIENLAAIDSIQKEMRLAVSYYRYRGESDYVVNDRFEVVDEVRNAKELFDELNDTLTASWDLMYEYAKSYYKENGDLDVPNRYKTIEGYALGRWVNTQRGIYLGIRYGVLSEEKIQKLEAIGMNWTTPKESAWQRNFEAAKAYYEEHGDLLVPVNYVDSNGYRLGLWIANLRTYRRVSSNTKSVTPEKIKMLDSIGMVWNVFDSVWEQYYNAAKDYYNEHGDLDVRHGYISPDGVKLGQWIHQIRSRYKSDKRSYFLSDAQIQALNDIGMVWDDTIEMRWRKNYSDAKVYYEEFGNLDVPINYLTADGKKLGMWIREQRKRRKLGRITQEQIELLDAIHMDWIGHRRSLDWMDWYQFAKAYYEEHGDLEVHPSYKVNGYWLGKWISNQRDIRNGKVDNQSLSDEQIHLLDEISMRWGLKKDKVWQEQLERTKAFYADKGHLNASTKSNDPAERTVGAWLVVQRRRFRNGELTDEQIKKLKSANCFFAVEDSPNKRSRAS